MNWLAISRNFVLPKNGNGDIVVLHSKKCEMTLGLYHTVRQKREYMMSYFVEAFRACSNSSPGLHCTRADWSAAWKASAIPKRASTALVR